MKRDSVEDREVRGLDEGSGESGATRDELAPELPPTSRAGLERAVEC
jgi:hypothetical protein